MELKTRPFLNQVL